MLKLVAALIFSLGAASASAVTILTATLSNGAENPPVSPTVALTGAARTSSGFATFVINDAMTSMTFSATIFGIDVTGSQSTDANDNIQASHIHAGAAVTPTTNGGVVWGFFGSPFNDNNPNDAVVTPFLSGVGGTFTGKWDALEGNNTTFTAQLDNILNGRAYINFHTTQFAGGEIRGNIQVAAIPEPETYVLLMGGAGFVLAAVRRQRRAASRA